MNREPGVGLYIRILVLMFSGLKGVRPVSLYAPVSTNERPVFYIKIRRC